MNEYAFPRIHILNKNLKAITGINLNKCKESQNTVQFKTNLYIFFPRLFLNSSFPYLKKSRGRVEEQNAYIFFIYLRNMIQEQ
ncbi:hypothetical protein BpHYR1_013191 [Brachionus plicatilis]|uniref:Uncharacterized protein n=1 Tax=Brachionus plicatilis TaxID=10195 RepID=A0A3M7QT30_BRAPC|nr:hypothetical protein BpHYR1_013191 [Brachionus plicatilis]